MPPTAPRSLAVLPAALMAALLMPALSTAESLGVRTILLTTHVQDQRDAPLEEYDLKLDDQGRHILTPGLELLYDRDLEHPLMGSLRARCALGLMRDSVGHLFGYAAVMGEWAIHRGVTTELLFHAGPGLIFRESWRDVEGYLADNPLVESSWFLRGYEYAFLPLGDFELSFRITDRSEFVWSLFPGIPYVVTQSVGVKWNL